MAKVLIDGDPLVALVENDPRTEVIIGPLGSQTQAEHFAETMTGVVVLTRRGDGWYVLQPHYDLRVGIHQAGASGDGTRRHTRHVREVR